MISHVSDLAPASEGVIIDLSNVEAVDTTFLRFLVDLKRHADELQQSPIKLVGVSHRVRRTFEVTGLAKFFEFENAALPA
jgi:anti-anti-sigma factor